MPKNSFVAEVTFKEYFSQRNFISSITTPVVIKMKREIKIHFKLKPSIGSCFMISFRIASRETHCIAFISNVF